VDQGFDTLAELGFALLPETPMAQTASGGLHLYFESADRIEIRNTAGAYGAGIGPQLDSRGEGGSIILPSPGSGYLWDPHWNSDTTILAPVPAVLLPHAAGRALSLQGTRPASGLSPYDDAALDNDCRRIIAAPPGEQEFVAICTGANGLWAGLPAKPEIDRDGRRKTDGNGKTVYAEVLRWRDRELSKRLSLAVAALLRRAHPDDLAA
jgi:hypothetical protein